MKYNSAINAGMWCSSEGRTELERSDHCHYDLIELAWTLHVYQHTTLLGNKNKCLLPVSGPQLTSVRVSEVEVLRLLGCVYDESL